MNCSYWKEKAVQTDNGLVDQLMVGAQIGRMLQKGSLILSAVSFFWLPSGSPNYVERIHLSAPTSALQKTHLNFIFQYGNKSVNFRSP